MDRVKVTRIKTHATDRKRCYLKNVLRIGEKCSCVVQAEKRYSLVSYALALSFINHKWVCSVNKYFARGSEAVVHKMNAWLSICDHNRTSNHETLNSTLI